MKEVNRYRDIQIDDKNIWDDFVSYWKDGKFGSAEILLNNNLSNLSKEALTADVINSITNALVELQTDGNPNKSGVVTQLKNDFQSNINQIKYMGEYSPYAEYNCLNFVVYNYSIYMCISEIENIVGYKPTNDKYWVKIGLRGDIGAGAISNFKGVWNSTTSYNLQDLVQFNDRIWGAIKTPTTGIAPGINPGGGPEWMALIYSVLSSIEYGYDEPTDKYRGQVWIQKMS